MWETVSSWTVVSVVVPLLVGVGVSVMSMTPPEFWVARVSFTVSAGVFLVKVTPWLAAVNVGGVERLLLTFLIFGVVGVGWAGAWRWVNTREATQRAASKTARSSISSTEAVQFVLDCRLGAPPAVIPPEGRILIMAPHKLRVESGGSGLIELFGEPGNPSHAPVITSPLSYRCELTNAASFPVFDISVTFNLEFRKALPAAGTSSFSGPVTFSRAWTFRAPGHLASNGRIAFYAFNNSVQEYIVMTTRDATCKTSIDSERRPAKVAMTGSLGGLLILSPPAPTPPPQVPSA
jgi:hypothetical protein